MTRRASSIPASVTVKPPPLRDPGLPSLGAGTACPLRPDAYRAPGLDQVRAASSQRRERAAPRNPHGTCTRPRLCPSWRGIRFQREPRPMSQDEPRRIGLSIELKPHAYDPVSSPELFEGVLARRVIAFFIDLAIITVPVVVAAMFIFLFGLFTLGLGWFLFWLLSPGAVIWALLYY